ncbi:hypothetical protein G210_1013 [Candida maltosa Xu316]|uniref:Uncharacterized protein n=1 Tax=Candida maltosa (strain Xu316) TaxID=1245528 RepID=M3J8I9_CANMX|nr:hypothetical protein G210_1013 [Candida maltosa Xu316]
MSQDPSTFQCQKCDSPLKLDESLKNLNNSQLKLLLKERKTQILQKANSEILDDLKPEEYIPEDRLKTFEEISELNQEPMIRRNYFESEDDEDEDDEGFDDSGFTSGSNSYLVLNESDEFEDTNNVKSESQSINGDDDEERGFKMSNRIKTLSKIFSILSNNQDINHPLSEDCANLLIENYKLKFDQSEKEKESYLLFLRKLKEKDSSLSLYDDDNINPDLLNQNLDKKLTESIEEFQKLTILEKENLQELKNLEATKIELEAQLADYEQQLDQLRNNRLNDILKLKNKLQLELNDKSKKLEQSKAAYDVQLDHIDKLRNLNIYHRIFDISCDSEDKFATINGFRLGYKIIWPEINAALGQIVLLLMFIIKRLNLNLKYYKLVPSGSQSQIIKINSQEGSGKTKTILNLYSSDEFSLGKLFNFNKLDVAMIALLDIVSIIETKLLYLDQEIELPYKILKDTIGGKSIRVTSNSDWTASCKFLLTNLNWILIFVSGHTSGEE